jgi:hypothetical protein
VGTLVALLVPLEGSWQGGAHGSCLHFFDKLSKKIEIKMIFILEINLKLRFWLV